MTKDIVGGCLIAAWLGVWALGFVWMAKELSRRRRNGPHR